MEHRSCLLRKISAALSTMKHSLASILESGSHFVASAEVCNQGQPQNERVAAFENVVSRSF